MQPQSFAMNPLMWATDALRVRHWLLLPPALLLCTAALFAADPVWVLFLLAGAGSLIGVVGLSYALRIGRSRGLRRIRRQVAGVVEWDSAPAFTTGPDGVIHYQNRAALGQFGDAGETLLRRLEGTFATPSSTLYRLQRQAEKAGAVREDVATTGGTTRISVHRIPGGYLWRLEKTPGADLAGRMAEPIALPRLIVNGRGTVLSMNRAARHFIGKEIQHLGDELPETLRSGEVLTLAGGRRAMVATSQAAAGRQEVFLLPDAEAAPRQPSDTLIFDDMPVGLLRIGGDGVILSANRHARELLAADVAPGARLSDLVEGLGRPVNDWLNDGFAGRTLGRPEVVRARQPNRETFLQVTLRRLGEQDEATLYAILHDATELKSLEAQFVQSQKMQAIGQLAGGVAHDFNNLLTAISGHCDLLLLRHDSNDPDYGDLVQIHQNANRAAGLVGQLLAFSRKQTLQPQLIDMRDALADLGHLLNRLVGERVRLNVICPHELDLIRADPRQLEQVLMNLVVNARDAMPMGGEIRIDAANRTLSEPLLRDRAVVPPGSYVVLRVVDEGTGIPEDRLTKIFEPFYTTKRAGEGTGLGLSTAYGIVKQTGGFIFVDSAVGQGATFSLYLPAQEGQPEPAAAAPVSSPPLPAHGTGVVLLVEDEAPVRAFASRALRLRGYTVLEAECAEDALELLSDSDLCVDIFVSDVIMPGRDGPSWVCEALLDRPGVKVVFMSGYAEDSFAETQARIPNSVFLPKPFSLSDLTATVQAQLQPASPTGSVGT